MPRTTTRRAISDSNPTAASTAPGSDRLPPPATTAADLFRRCTFDRCERAWREFVERFHARLFCAVRRVLLDLDPAGTFDERAEDLLQEVYCRLLGDGLRRQRFFGSTEAQLMAYLLRVVHSVVIDARREALAEKRWGGHRVTWADWRQLPALEVVEDDDPEERLLREERRRAFLAICRQSLGRRADATTVRIARLALLEGWSSREIAARLGGRMGVAGIDTVIHRLRRNLAGRGIELPCRVRRSGPRPVAGAGVGIGTGLAVGPNTSRARPATGARESRARGA